MNPVLSVEHERKLRRAFLAQPKHFRAVGKCDQVPRVAGAAVFEVK